MHVLVLFYFAGLCSLSTLSVAEASKSLNGFSIDLIHRDSPLSPFYNSTMTPSELIRNAALRSISRSNRVDRSLYENESAEPETIMIPDQNDYLMRFYIGTPPVERLAFADTGSDLVWIQCSPCEECFHQNTSLFDPKKSSTFMGLSCDSEPCTLLPKGQQSCGNSRECNYVYAYGDQSFTKGELGNDSINFGSTGAGQAVTFPKFVFGCGYNNTLTAEPIDKTSGFVGLGGGPLSLVSQLGAEIGHKFSYCLLPFSSNSTSKLKFGNQAMISGNGVVSTPLITNSSSPTFYYVNLEGITVGQKTVQTGESGGNIIIDSGTTLTYLKPSFYNNFVTLVKEAIGVDAVKSPPTPFNLCFEYNPSMNFPHFVFHFTGADIPLNATKNLFSVISNNLLCLAVLPTNTEIGVSIFGNVAQVDLQVLFDREGRKVSFAPTDCTKN